MISIKLNETEDMDLPSPAFNNIFEPTFNDSFLSNWILETCEIMTNLS